MADEPMTEAEATDAIWSLAKSIDFCMFVTWDGERQRARPLSARVHRDEGLIHFLVDATGKVDEQIMSFPKVLMTFADVRGHDYVAITGTATVTDDRALVERLWSAADKAWWDGPEDPAIRVVTVAPEDGEVWKGENRMVVAAKLLTAAVTGMKVDMGENAKVDQL